MANQQQVLTLADFDKNLAEMTTGDAVQLFKQLIDKSMASGIFKSIDTAAQYYQALKILDASIASKSLPEAGANATEENDTKEEK